jgi:23S rRNA (guanine745-N1)-methyltransferase
MARSGYVHLARADSGGGDARAAVRARTAFLSAGYYAVAAEALCALTARYVPKTGLIVDAGCGEGYYTNRLAASGERQYELCGFDLSRDAVDAAAKAARREEIDAQFAVASLFELPLAEASVDAVVNIFAPCAEAEFCRVLKPGGVLILLGAGERHLLGLKRALYDETYENAQRADLPAGMALVERQVVRDEIEVVGQEQIEHLFSMTPYYWRTSPQDKQKLSQLERLVTEIEFDCRVYRKIQ